MYIEWNIKRKTIHSGVKKKQDEQTCTVLEQKKHKEM